MEDVKVVGEMANGSLEPEAPVALDSQAVGEADAEHASAVGHCVCGHLRRQCGGCWGNVGITAVPHRDVGCVSGSSGVRDEGASTGPDCCSQ